MRDYEPEFSCEEQALALKEIIKLCIDLGDPAGRPMTMPTLAFASDEIECDQFGFDTGGKFSLVIDVEEFTDGRVKTLTPKELQLLLFNERVTETVTIAMLNVMAWINDVQSRGSNAFNEQQVKGFLGHIAVAIAEGLGKGLSPRP